MSRAQQFLNPLFAGSYMDIVRGTGPITYWPLNEPSGAAAIEVMHGMNGAHTGVTLGQSGIGDGLTCPFYDGTTDYTNVLTAPFAAAFNGSEGSVMVWWKHDALSHNDSVVRRLLAVSPNVNNYIRITKTGSNSTMQGSYYAGAVLEISMLTVAALRTDFSLFTITWSKTDDRAIYYDNGAAYETDTVLGNWAGVPTVAIIGANVSTPLVLYYGWLAHCAVWNRPLSAGEVKMLYEARYC